MHSVKNGRGFEGRERKNAEKIEVKCGSFLDGCFYSNQKKGGRGMMVGTWNMVVAKQHGVGNQIEVVYVCGR